MTESLRLPLGLMTLRDGKKLRYLLLPDSFQQ